MKKPESICIFGDGINAKDKNYNYRFGKRVE